MELKKAEKKHEGEFEYISFWLSNTCRFLHNMEQYSGDECRQCWSMKQFKVFLSSSVKPSGMRGRSSSRSGDQAESVFTVDSIIKKLTAYHITMNQHRMDQILIQQIFKQVMYGITAHTINNQLLRKELCNWSKAMQIRYVSQLEDWIRESNLGDCELREMLEPLVQASQLLQVKKQSDQDAIEICQMCTQLSPAQIVKLLNMITPTNDYEERVPVKFIKTVQAKLKQERPDSSRGCQTLLIDNGFMFGVTFPYSPSTVSLDRITIPESLNLAYLKLI